jgi:DNA-binding SARP family transcriptional activator
MGESGKDKAVLAEHDLFRRIQESEWDELVPLLDHGDAGRVTDRLRGLLHGRDLPIRLKASLLIFLSQLWRGHNRQNEELLLELRLDFCGADSSPQANLTISLLEAMQHYLGARTDSSRHQLAAAEKLAQANRLHHPDHLLLFCAATAAMLEGNSATVQRTLKKMAVKALNGRPLFRIDYHTLSAWYALIQGRYMLALEHLHSLQPTVQTFASSYHQAVWHLGYAQVLIHQHQLSEADRELAQASDLGLRRPNLLVRFMTLLMRAQWAFASGNNEQGLVQLREGLAIGREQRYLSFIWWEARTVADLCARALAANIEKDYVLHLVRERRLAPESPPVDIENWPWRLRIYTLGRFWLIIDNHQVDLAGRNKSQKKPLELLKALLAMGGSAQEHDLIDLLWADSDGDSSRQTFKVNLHRLRQLLGVEGAIRLQDGVVSIDRRLVWVDVWALDNLFLRLRCSDSILDDVMARLVEKALNLYFGGFLDGEERGWLVSPRQKIKSRFLVLVSRLAQTFEQKLQWQKAAEVYLRGLEVEDLSEDLYRRLMLCYLQVGCRGEALQAYQRCRNTLAAVAELEPSAATDAVLQRLLAKDGA